MVPSSVGTESKVSSYPLHIVYLWCKDKGFDRNYQKFFHFLCICAEGITTYDAKPLIIREGAKRMTLLSSDMAKFQVNSIRHNY